MIPAFTKYRSSATDPYWSFVQSLLHFDGANGSTTFTDQISGVTWTPSGSAQLSTANPKFGTAAGLFANATSDGITSNTVPAFSFGTGDFTIEFFLYISATAQATAWDNRFGSYGTALVLYTDNSTPGRWALYAGSANQLYVTISSGVWHHLAICRASGTTRLFLDGVQQGSFSDANAYSQQQFCIGKRYTTANQSVSGNIDEFRLTPGVARYTANFTPPSAAFPNS